MEGTLHDEGGGWFAAFNLLIAARWMHFAAVFLLFGGSFFWIYAGHAGAVQGSGGLPQTFRITVRLLRLAAPVAAVSGVIWFAAMLANMTGDAASLANPETLRLFFFQTPFGTPTLLRLGLLLAAVIIAALPWRNWAGFPAFFCISAALLISQAWLGHAAEGGTGLYGTAMICAYALHVLAAAAWLGGLPPLLLALIEESGLDQRKAREGSLDLLIRYSLMGMIAVAIIVLSGTINAGFRVAGSFDKLFETPYGNVLTVKIALVALMLGLASYNRFAAMPKLCAEALEGSAQFKKLEASIAFETGLGVLVLGAAAVLGITPPPQ